VVAHRSTVVTAGSVLLMASGIIPVALVGALAPKLQYEFGVGNSWIGIAVAVFFATAGIASFPSGRIADRLGWRPTYFVSAGTMSLLLVAIALAARDASMLLGLLCLSGVAMAFSVTTSNLAMARELPRHRLGLGLGVKQAAVPIAGIAAGGIVSTIAVPYGWRAAYIAAASVPVLAVAIGLSGRQSVNPPRRTLAPEEMKRGTSQESSGLFLLAGAMALATIMPGVLTGFVVVSAVDVGFSIAEAALLLAVSSAMGVLSRIGLGWLIDRLSGDGLREVSVVLLVGAGGGLLIASQEAVLFVAGTLIAFAAGWGWPPLMYYGLIQRNPGAPGMATGAVQTGGFLGTAGGPLVFGLLYDSWGFRASWAAISAFVLAASLLSHLARHRMNSAPVRQ
jgi:MFS family permease